MKQLAAVALGAVLGWVGQWLAHRQSAKEATERDQRVESAARQARVEACMRELLSVASDMRLEVRRSGSEQIDEVWQPMVERAWVLVPIVQDEATRRALETWLDVAWLAEGIAQRLGRPWPDVVWEASVAVERIAGCVIRGEVDRRAVPVTLQAALTTEKDAQAKAFATWSPDDATERFEPGPQPAT